MKKPHKCPVCNGSGAVIEQSFTTSTAVNTVVCHPCKGEGIVWELLDDYPPVMAQGTGAAPVIVDPDSIINPTNPYPSDVYKPPDRDTDIFKK